MRIKMPKTYIDKSYKLKLLQTSNKFYNSLEIILK